MFKFFRLLRQFFDFSAPARKLARLPEQGAPFYFDQKRGLYYKPAATVGEWRRNMRRLMKARQGLGVVLLLLLVDTVAAAPYRTYGQLTVAATAVPLTSTVINPNGWPQMRHCLLRLETAEIRWRIDGIAPTSSVGAPLEPLETLLLDAPEEIQAFRAIGTGGTSGTLNITCWN